jgi:hypothetical protein
MYLLTRHAHSVGQEEISPGSRSVAEWGCVDLVWPSALRIARSCSTEEPSDPLVFRFVAAGGCRANGAALWSTDDQPRLAYSCGRGRPPQWSMQRGGCRRPSRRSSSRDSALVSAVARTSGSARARVRLRHGHDGRCDVRPARSSATRAHSARRTIRRLRSRLLPSHRLDPPKRRRQADVHVPCSGRDGTRTRADSEGATATRRGGVHPPPHSERLGHGSDRRHAPRCVAPVAGRPLCNPRRRALCLAHLAGRHASDAVAVPLPVHHERFIASLLANSLTRCHLRVGLTAGVRPCAPTVGA